MKLGLMISFQNLEALEEKFKMLKEYDVHSCQLLTRPHHYNDENAEGINRLTAQYGITISACWCMWIGPCVWSFYEGHKTLGLVPPEWREVRIGNLCDGSDFAKKLGVSDIITHMGFIYEDPNHPDFKPFCEGVRKVAEHCKKNGQYLLFETGQETPVVLLRCFEEVGMDNLGVNLDTANCILYGKANPVDALDLLGPYVRNLHAKDGFYPTNGKSLGRQVELGEGKVDFKALFTRLREFGFDSFVTIEHEVPNAPHDEGVIHSIQYLRGVFADLQIELN